MKQKQMIITIVVVLVVAGLAFFGGMRYQKAEGATTMMGQFGQNGQGFRGMNGQGRFGARNGNGATIGQIVSIDANSMMVKLTDGSSKIVNLSDSTIYSKTDTATKSDLKTGTKVAAFGTTNSDGSITAQNVQINPMFRMGARAGQRPTQ